MMTERHGSGRTVRSRLLLAAMVTALATTTACSGGGGTGPSPSIATDRPMPASDLNVVVIVMDDASDIACADFATFMPKTAALLRDRGTCFEDATATAPTCAPSRAALMTSQMGHNSGAPRQTDAINVRAGDTIQETLTDAGYTTYGTGKYFNGIQAFDVESGKIDSGFESSDFWSSSRPYGYQLWDDRTQQPYQPQDHLHATTRTGDFLRSFITSQKDAERPFYAYAAFKAPHTDNSAPSLTGRMPEATPRNRTRPVPPFHYDPERDTRDKLPIFQKQLASRGYYQELYAARTRAQYDIDDEMRKTFATLRDQGQLDHTAVFFTSDQGYHLGENGWETKGDPYSTTMDVPLLAWLPTSPYPGRVDERPVGLIDIGPTIYDLTGVAPDHLLDGRSLLSPRRREGTYFEVVNEVAKPDYRRSRYSPERVPTWSMYRSGNRAYIEFYDSDGTRIRSEFYRDHAMKDNLLWRGSRQKPSTRTLTHFRAQLQLGRTCAGTAEQGSPDPCP